MAENSLWQQDRYAALCLRANAHRLVFPDPAAQWMLERLGGGNKGGKHSQEEQQALRRSGWFDRRCELFFARYPEALCIELGAGFSTRFHRLSARADWPRFHWVEVDTLEVIQQKTDLLPSIDNFQLIASEITSQDWLQAWKGEPLILVAEHQMKDLLPGEVAVLFSNIAIRAKQLAKIIGQHPPVEVAFDYCKNPYFRLRQWLSMVGLHLTANMPKNSAESLWTINPEYSLVSEVCLDDFAHINMTWLNRCYEWISRGRHREMCTAVALNHP